MDSDDATEKINEHLFGSNIEMIKVEKGRIVFPDGSSEPGKVREISTDKKDGKNIVTVVLEPKKEGNVERQKTIIITYSSKERHIHWDIKTKKTTTTIDTIGTKEPLNVGKR
ncbi:MAG: hypothetical protein ABIH83_01975 [Candidatus Micrarchaeota archaeon]